jgi:XTP/dITP diphosphohydrolase
MSEEKLVWTLGSENLHKLEEFASLLSGVPVQPVSLPAGSKLPPETGKTLMANAQIKARGAAAISGGIALADDTGLEVDALGGEPGVYSSRYAGEGVSYEDNNRKLLERLTGIHGVNRRARFRCVLVLATPDGTELSAEGRVEGFIIDSPRGEGGFGYDPLFQPEGMEKTLAELTPEEKNALSHRARAVENLRQNLERLGRWSP